MDNNNDNNLPFLQSYDFKTVQFAAEINYITASITSNSFSSVNNLSVLQRKADQHRMMLLLNPILTSEHREKMYTRNYILMPPT
jgi:hypothetical protein